MVKIKIYSRLGQNLVTRSSIEELFRFINALDELNIILDFEKVQFISRSCADEYIKQKNRTKKKINDINIGSNVEKMLNFVINSYNAPRKTNFRMESKSILLLA